MRKLSIICISLCFAHAATAQVSAQQLNTTLENLNKSKETEAQLKQRLAESARELEAIRARAASIGERLQTSEQRVTSEEEALAKVNSQVAQKREEFDARKQDYIKTVLSLLRLRNLPPTAVFSAGEDAQALLRTASLLEKTNQAVAQKAARLRGDITQLKKLQTDAKLRDASTRAEKATLRREQETLARELASRQKLQTQLSADHERAGTSRQTLA
jgi:septal ring factor EnvC (AmiA/AmiB activator)